MAIVTPVIVPTTTPVKPLYSPLPSVNPDEWVEDDD